MAFSRFIKRAPPRILLRSHISDVRETDAKHLMVDALNAPQAVNLLAESYRQESIKFSEANNSLLVPSTSAVGRVLELLPKMDPVLVVRACCAIFLRSESVSEVSEFAESVLVRMDELGLQQISRLMFAAVNSKLMDSSVLDQLLLRAEECVFAMLSNRSEVSSPRVLAKLCVAFSKSELILPLLLRHVIKSMNSMEGEHIQQIAFAAGNKAELKLPLLQRALALSPLRCPKTYSALLISLRTTSNADTNDLMISFCLVYRGHFGIPLRGFIALDKLRASLQEKGYTATDTQLRLVRNVLNR